MNTLRTPPSHEPPAPTVRFRRYGTIAAAAVLSLGTAGCTAENTGPEPDRGKSKSDKGSICVTPEIPVDPGSALNRSNQGDIASQLDALRTAHSPTAEVTVRNVVNAGSIVANSLKDPQYARAFRYANRQPSRVDSAGRLIAMEFAGNRQKCLQQWQVDTSQELYDALVDGLAPKAGRQISTAAELLYDGFDNGFDEFMKEVRP